MFKIIGYILMVDGVLSILNKKQVHNILYDSVRILRVCLGLTLVLLA